MFQKKSISGLALLTVSMAFIVQATGASADWHGHDWRSHDHRGHEHHERYQDQRYPIYVIPPGGIGYSTATPCARPGNWGPLNSYPYGRRGCGWYGGQWYPGGYAGYAVPTPPTPTYCENPGNWAPINSYPYGRRGCGWYGGRWFPGGYAGYRY